MVFVKDLGLGNGKTRFYRFGIHSGGSDAALDGLHMLNDHSTDEVKLSLSPAGAKLEVTGNTDAAQANQALVEFTTMPDHVAPTGGQTCNLYRIR